MKTLIMGIGNPILTDDGVGIRIAEAIKTERPGVEMIETSEAGMALVDYVAGYDKLIIVDSIITGREKPGSLYKLDLEQLGPAIDSPSSHGLDIATAFKLGEGLGYKMPQIVSLYAVEIRDNTTFGEECTEEVWERIPLAVEQIMEEERL